METKPTTPSVIARLMGLDELPSHRPVKKQKLQRVLSENYLRRVASVGVWEKRSCDEGRSFRFGIEEKKEIKDAFEVTESLERDRGSGLYAAKGRIGLLQEKVPSRTDEENPRLLKKFENCFVKDSQWKYTPDGASMVPRCHLESKNKRDPSFRRIVILKPKPGEAENATNFLSSPCSSEDCYLGKRKDKVFPSHWKGNSHVQAKERKNFSYGAKSTGHRSILSSETEQEITRTTRHNTSGISFEPPRLGFSGVYSRAKEPDFMMVCSPNNYDLNNCSKPSCNYLDGSYVAQEAKKQIAERWRMKNEFRENELTIGGGGRSRTLGEMLALPDRDKCVNFCGPLGISSRDGWKNGGVGDLIKSRSPAYSIRLQNWSSHKAFHDDSYMTMRPTFSLNWSRLKSSKERSNGKHGLERRNSGSKYSKSQSSPYIEAQKNHSLEEKYVVHNMSKNNLKKQDPSEESSIVCNSLKHNIDHPVSENKITPTDQWNDINDRYGTAEGSAAPESSVFTAASPSIAPNLVVAIENVAFCKSTANNNHHKLESTGCTMSEKDDGSSFCIPDALGQQEDISMEISEECGTDPDSLVNSETAYQPSPVSVLEAPFGEESLSSSKCFQNVSASLHDVRRQLEFLKSESPEEYSEGPGMVVSSDDDDDDDDDAGEESLLDCEVNKDLTRSFGVEESRDLSYLVDVFTEAGFYSRNKGIGLDGWHSPEIPISPSVFETLEKKYGEQISWKRSARRLLFDRINSGLLEILQPCLGEPTWAQPVVRRLTGRLNLKVIKEELHILLVNQELEARKESSKKVLGKDDGCLFLGYEIEVIGKEIENSLIDELLAEIVRVEGF